MKLQELNYKQFLFISLLIIALGIVFNTSLKEQTGAMGNVLIAIGGLSLIIAMSKKRQNDQNKK